MVAVMADGERWGRSVDDSIGQESDGRALIMAGESVGLALMLSEDVAQLAHWNQDLEFTARMGTPGDAHTLEMREEFFEQNSRMRPDSAEFGVIELGTGQLVGFGGLFDITRAMTATMFVGIGDAASRNKGWGTEASRLICEYGFFFRNLHSIKVEVHAYNREAIRVYERLGFQTVGRLRGANLLNNRRYDEIIMDLLRDEFEPRHVARFEGLQAEGD
jgi:RimJ/RimL family protein N-acetyltransferase